MNNQHDPEMEGLLNQLSDHDPRDPQAAEKSKAQFLSQAQSFAQGVSPQPNRRHRGWNKILFERMNITMKPPLKSIAWISITLLTVVAIFLATNTTPVSAQQILERASEAQAKAEAAMGIIHNQIRVYHNPGTVDGEGDTTITDDYYDSSTGFYRIETRDENGMVLSICSTDGTFSYYAPPTYNGSELIIERSPAESKLADTESATLSSDEPSASSDRASVDEVMRGAFSQFYGNPRVEVEEEKTWTDGSAVYVLVNRNYQTEKISDNENKSTLTGTTRMVFNKETYQLLQMETTVHKDGKDILIYKVEFLLKETLPSDTDIIWDLSDLGNASFVDAEIPIEREMIIDTLNREELAQYTQAFVLEPVPDGFSEEILAIDSDGNEGYDGYEIHYRNADGVSFSLQDIGLLETNFVEENFYDGSYKAASGLVLYFSISSSENTTSSMLATPNGNGYLLYADMPREEVEDLVDTLIPVQ